MSSHLNDLAEFAWVQIWQVTIVAAVSLLLVRAFCKKRPHLAYVLLLVVVVKCLTPPILSSPFGIFGWTWNAPSQSIVGTGFSNEARGPDGPAARTSDVAANSHGRISGEEATRVGANEVQDPKASDIGLYLLLAWACGAIACASIITTAWLKQLVSVRKASRPAGEPLVTLTERIARQVGLKRRVGVLVCSDSHGPFCFGLFAPHIVLPDIVASKSASDTIEPVIAHELIHVRRGDTAIAPVQMVACVIWWFHPLIWVVSRKLSLQREKCCDEEVVAGRVCEPARYAQGMLDVARFCRRLRPASLANGIRSADVTKERLEAIMSKRSGLNARTPWSCWVLLLALAVLVIPGRPPLSAPAQAGSSSDESEDPMAEIRREEPTKSLALKTTEQSLVSDDDAQASTDDHTNKEKPKLLYLTWQSNGIPSTGKPIPHTLWDLDGKVVDAQLAHEVLEKVGSFDLARRSESELRPLALVFKVDQEISYCPVVPIVITADGTKHAESFARNRPTNGLNISAAMPNMATLPKWPGQVAIEITFPIDNRTVIDTIKDVPKDPLRIAPGVQWYLDPTRVMERDNGAGRLDATADKTAAVLQIARDRPDPLTTYRVRIYLKGRELPVSELYVTIIKPDGKQNEIRVSEAFAGKDAIDRLEIVRQRHDVSRIDDVPLRVDLLGGPDNADRD